MRPTIVWACMMVCLVSATRHNRKYPIRRTPPLFYRVGDIQFNTKKVNVEQDGSSSEDDGLYPSAEAEQNPIAAGPSGPYAAAAVAPPVQPAEPNPEYGQPEPEPQSYIPAELYPAASPPLPPVPATQYGPPPFELVADFPKTNLKLSVQPTAKHSLPAGPYAAASPPSNYPAPAPPSLPPPPPTPPSAAPSTQYSLPVIPDEQYGPPAAPNLPQSQPSFQPSPPSNFPSNLPSSLQQAFQEKYRPPALPQPVPIPPQSAAPTAQNPYPALASYPVRAPSKPATVYATPGAF